MSCSLPLHQASSCAKLFWRSRGVTIAFHAASLAARVRPTEEDLIVLFHHVGHGACMHFLLIATVCVVALLQCCIDASDLNCPQAVDRNKDNVEPGYVIGFSLTPGLGIAAVHPIP